MCTTMTTMTPSTHPDIPRLEQMLARSLAQYAAGLRDTRTKLIGVLSRVARLQDALGDHASAPLLHVLRIECFVILRRIDAFGSVPLPSETEIAELMERAQRIGDALAGLVPELAAT
jgi:hypothetical protein